ncbi:membrane protein [Salinarimonas rosea]|uniref:membrane protein n=1 Tax=Salinarimonas rosea TaxID=552063 RepID=UPI000418CCD1|nr:membrane protein [Salinarimonas rosea]
MLTLSFSPLVPEPVLWAAAALAAVVAILSVLARGAPAALRALALAILVLALANPALVEEEREPVDDVVAIVVDESASQDLGERAAMTQAVREELDRRLSAMQNVVPRFIAVTDGAGDDGTLLFRALANGLADVPPDRIAGVILVTDGVVHDIPEGAGQLGFRAPLHALITGRESERDRQIRLVRAPRFGIVGRKQTIEAMVEERNGTGSAVVTVRRDGEIMARRDVPTGRAFTVPVTIDRGGANVVEIDVEPLDDELTRANNRAVVEVEGIRENLRVLLVSGEPHAGERAWRNLLKSDANVDLVHFTILRPPHKQDGTPIDELSLIAFPTRELFQEKIDEFDLIIFDRYANQSILPSIYFDNIVAYVENGGAVLFAAGPEFATVASLARTRLAPIIPGMPTGEILEEPYKAEITPVGGRHPVTRGLDGSEVSPPAWGEWLRLLDADVHAGDTVMSGVDGRPLLVLERYDEGRVALLLSDHAWLWARGFREGGPYLDLLRRTAHWLMKEPALEEEALRASADGRAITIERQSMGEAPSPVTLTAPSGESVRVGLEPGAPGLWRARVTGAELGLHELRADGLVAFVSVGPANPREMRDVFSSTAHLAPLVAETGGSVRRLAEGAGAVVVPRIQTVRSDARLSGADWIGIRPSEAAVVRGVSVVPLALGFVGVVLLLGAVLAGWLAEGARRRA